MSFSFKFRLCRLCLSGHGNRINIIEDKVGLDFVVDGVIEDLIKIKVVRDAVYPWLVCASCLEKLNDFRLFKQRCVESQFVYENRFDKGCFNKKGNLTARAKTVNGHLPNYLDNGTVQVYAAQITNNEGDGPGTETVSLLTPDTIVDALDATLKRGVELPNHGDSISVDARIFGHRAEKETGGRFDTSFSSQETSFSGEVVDKEEGDEMQQMETPAQQGSYGEIKDAGAMQQDGWNEKSDALSQCVGDDGSVEGEEKGMCVSEHDGGDDENVDSHSTIIDTGRVWTCQICQYSSDTNAKLKTHMVVHTKEKPHTCKDCGKSFRQRNGLEVHQRIHTGGRPLLCNICSESFCHMPPFKIHMAKHEGDNPFTCHFCLAAFAEKNALVVHLRTHMGEVRYDCSTCGMAFNSQGGLRDHAETHTLKPFTCQVCSKSFGRKCYLKDHMLVHRTLKEVHICHWCSKGFKRRKYLMQHLKFRSCLKLQSKC